MQRTWKQEGENGPVLTVSPNENTIILNCDKNKILKINPKRTCLLVVDMCNIFVSDIPQNRELRTPIAPINSIAKALRKAGGIVAFTNWGLDPGGHELPPAVKASFTPGSVEALTKGSDDVKLCPDMDVADNDLHFDKIRYGAFHETKLDSTLRNRGITTILITGVLTDVCVLSSAMQASDRCYDVIMVKDGVATKQSPLLDRTVEEATNTTFALVNIFGALATSADVVSALHC
eukprot:TRINITY_DN113963_c0_g1_i1.p1 TRINITY_DN113963_c0_g1~~TRINITY_DN113963_c0_g1_i1.p1  ORF type:complete len:234 (-),score=34.07 TRINITY_DN113963_c0_g1_i1:315-1016(-)